MVVVFPTKQSLLDEQPPITRTCIAIWQEALPIYYSENHFEVRLSGDPLEPTPDQVERLYTLSESMKSRGLGTSLLGLIRNIDIHVMQIYWAPVTSERPLDSRDRIYFHVSCCVRMSCADALQQLPAPTLVNWFRVGDAYLDWTDYTATRKAYIAVCNEAKEELDEALPPWRPSLDRAVEHPLDAVHEKRLSRMVDNFIDTT